MNPSSAESAVSRKTWATAGCPPPICCLDADPQSISRSGVRGVLEVVGATDYTICLDRPSNAARGMGSPLRPGPAPRRHLPAAMQV